MSDCRDEEDDNGGEGVCCCYFHPREIVVGVCAFCLHERLSAIASSQKRTRRHFHHTFCSLKRVLGLTRFVDRVENCSRRQKKSDACSSSRCSQEDSFISIKFEANGVALWGKEKIPKIPLNPQCDKSWSQGNVNKVKKIKKGVLEHLKSRGMLRWRRWIGSFSLFRWKKSKKESRCKRTKVERFGWISSLRKRTK